MTPEKLQEIRGVHSAIDLKNASDSQIICLYVDCMSLVEEVERLQKENEYLNTAHEACRVSYYTSLQEVKRYREAIEKALAELHWATELDTNVYDAKVILENALKGASL